MSYPTIPSFETFHTDLTAMATWIINSFKTPGVGAYNIEKSVAKKQQPKFSIRGRYIPKISATDVSPASYNTDKSTNQTSSFTIRPRYNPQAPYNTPGVGSYNIDRHESGAGFSISIKPKPFVDAATPGVGQYNITREYNGQGFTMGKRTKIGPDDLNPGVGAYDLDKGTNSGPKYTIQMNTNKKPFSDTPGPGSYKAKDTNMGTHGITMSFRTNYCIK